MKVRLPSPRKTSWYARETTRAIGEIALSVLAAVLVVVAALDAYDSKRPAKLVAAVGAIVAIALVCANGCLRFLAARKKDREAGDLSDPKHLLGPLLVLTSSAGAGRPVAGSWVWSFRELAQGESMSGIKSSMSKLVSSTHIEKETPNGSQVISMELTDDLREALTVRAKSGEKQKG